MSEPQIVDCPRFNCTLALRSCVARHEAPLPWSRGQGRPVKVRQPYPLDPMADCRPCELGAARAALLRAPGASGHKESPMQDPVKVLSDPTPPECLAPVLAPEPVPEPQTPEPAPAEQVEGKPCAWCGRLFVGRRSDQRFCCTACRGRYSDRARGKTTGQRSGTAPALPPEPRPRPCVAWPEPGHEPAVPDALAAPSAPEPQAPEPAPASQAPASQPYPERRERLVLALFEAEQELPEPAELPMGYAMQVFRYVREQLKDLAA